MTEKKIQDNVLSDDSDKKETPASDELKKRIGSRLPEGVDISSIGNIDLYEAEKIATEEIVFLTEDDLIEGLEDFELIPLKNDASYSEKTEHQAEKQKGAASGLRIKTISSEEGSDEIKDAPVMKNEEYSDPSEEIIFEAESPEDSVEKHSAILNLETVDSKDSNTALSRQSDVISEDAEAEEFLSASDSETDKMVKDLTESEVADENPGLDDDAHLSVNIKEYPGKEPGRITENSINIQFDEIFSESEEGDENIPARFQDIPLSEDVNFIDDLKVSRGISSLSSSSEDPLIDRLARIIHVSDTPMSVITERSDYYDDHAYLLQDKTLYEKGAVAAVENEEIFYGDPDLDFFEHAIVKNDFSRFIQEIDDYYDITVIESESRISEILGMNPEEREIVNDELFSGYYSNIDFDSEIYFLNPDLDFINRSLVESKDVNYLLDNPDSLADEDKLSIEDDITSGSAIVFEEDVDDLKILMERDYGTTARERIENEISSDSGLSVDVEIIEPVTEPERIYADDESSDIIDITDQVIILEDKENMDAFTSQFPDKKEDLVKLLSYLDGLFEKLPEEAVKKFAQSEYFDLYVKVMNEIGA
jgi:hypothetical protein